MTFIKTIICDLEINRQLLLHLLNDNEQNGVIEFSFIQNFSLIIHEVLVSLDLSLNDVVLQNDIEAIRHKMKGIRQGSKEVLKDIIVAHINYFGDDVDNIGFYHVSNSVRGSTLYPLFLMQGTSIMSPVSINHGLGGKFKDIGFRLGSLTSEIIAHIHELDIEKDISIEIKPTNLTQVYESKDTHHSEVFKLDESTRDVLLFQVILKKQEIAFARWLLDSLDKNIFANRYIKLRYLAIIAYEMKRMLGNAEKFLNNEYEKLNEISHGHFDRIIRFYESELNSECRKLRNFLHYDPKHENFYDYCLTHEQKMGNYLNKVSEDIWSEWLLPLDDIFDKFINLNPMKSRTDMELIESRLRTLILQNDN